MHEAVSLTADSVATVTVRVEQAYAGGIGPPWSVGAPLNGALRLVLTDGTQITSDLSAGVTAVPSVGEPPDEEFSHGLLDEVFHVALPTLVGIDRLAFETDAGSYALVADTSGTTTRLINLWLRVGCQRDWYNFNQCKADAAGPLKGAKFGLSATVTAAPVAEFVLGDSSDVACGGTATHRIRAVTADGGDAWMDPREILTLSVPPSAGHFDGALDPNDGWLQVDALTAYSGVLFRAASCDVVADTTDIEFRVWYQHQGLEVSAGTFRVLPRTGWPPPIDPPTCRTGGRSGECSTPVVQVLQQNGDALPTSGPDAYVMVSEVRPDWLLPQQDLPFLPEGYADRAPYPDDGLVDESDLSDYYDPHTYRFDVSGVPEAVPDGAVEIRLDLSGEPIWGRGWQDDEDTRLTHATYEAICEAVGDGTKRCRSKRFVRLVSNARPVEMQIAPGTGEYDDEVAGLQTIRVELGALVRVWASYPDPETGATQESSLASYLVGSSDPLSVDAVRTAVVRFVEFEGTNPPVDPEATVARMSEDWAQVGVRFKLAEEDGHVLVPPVSNAIVLFTPVQPVTQENITYVPTAGPVTVTVTPQGGLPITVTFRVELQTETVESVAERIVDAFEARGLSSAYSRVFIAPEGFSGREAFIIVADPGHGAEIALDGSETGLRAEAFEFRYWHVEAAERSYISQVAMMNYGDDDRATIDFIVVPKNSLSGSNGRVNGFATADTASRLYWGSATVNTSMIEIEGVEGDDFEDALTAGHEAGHILMGEVVPDPDPDHPTHSVNPLSLMAEPQDTEISEQPYGRKRLSRIQQQVVLDESGQAVRDGEVLLLTPGWGDN